VEAIILGIGGMMPMPNRALASAMLRHDGRSTLFDCGEGTQVPIKTAGLGVGHIDALAVTHLHADHVTGIPGMLMLIGQADDDRPRDLLALPAVCEYVAQTRRLLGFHMPFELRYHALDAAGGTFEGDGFTLRWAPLDHRIPNLGFRYEEATRPGRFDATRADELGVPRGPARRALQRGEDIEVDGRRIASAEVVGPPRRGRRFAYVTDTRPCDSAEDLLRDVDLAVIEGMFANVHAREAAEKMHMTAAEAAEVVRRAAAKRALLTHVSTRYDDVELRSLEREARDVCEVVSLATPLGRYPIPFPAD
jgi:ribonuclease Z